MRPATYDPVRTLYRTLLVFDIVAILILAIGLGEFLYFEPAGQTTGASVRVAIYQYDSTTNMTIGPERSSFARAQLFAAVVDWSSLQQDIIVDARWYDSFESVVGRAGPGTPSQLAAATTIPVGVPKGLKYNLPGQYIFVVERLEGGVPVEILARRLVLVERT